MANPRTRKIPLDTRRLKRANILLRRVYNVVEMQHLTNMKLAGNYHDLTDFTHSLGEAIFNHLQNDKDFQRFVIKRQKRFRNKEKKEAHNAAKRVIAQLKADR